jgi:hypothetical protein
MEALASTPSDDVLAAPQMAWAGTRRARSFRLVNHHSPEPAAGLRGKEAEP